MRSRSLRALGITVGALIILAVGLYGPATLLGPLPVVAIEPVATAPQAATTPTLRLPDTGASAVALVDDASSTALPLASAGISDAVPIGGATKLVTALVALDGKAPAPGADGDDVVIAPADYTDYLDYRSAGARVLDVSPGETWTLRDVTRAVVLSSSNNHADTLARWSFGSVGAYVVAANDWLAEHGFTSMRVVDATGLSGENVGTADDLARIAGLVHGHPMLGEIYDSADEQAFGERLIPDVSAHLSDSGIRSLSRSFTDQAGLCLIFTAEVQTDGDSATVAAAFLRMPDYETLDPAAIDLVASVSEGMVPLVIIGQDETYATVTAPWGDRANAVAASQQTLPAFSGGAVALSIQIEPFTTAGAGQIIGRVRAETAGGELSVPLELDSTVSDPGPLWRLTNPIPMIGAFIEAQNAG